MRTLVPVLVALSLVSCKKKEEAQPAYTDGFTDEPSSDELSIEITSPEAGSHVAVGTVQVEGEHVGMESLTVNGASVSDEGGTFSTEVEVERGVNAIEAQGENGTIVKLTRRSVLAGEFAVAEGPIDEALGVRINEGGLEALGGLVGGLMNPADLTASLSKAGPVYESFVVDVYVQGVSFAPMQMVFQPTPGNLYLDVIIPDLEALLLLDTLGDIDLEVTATEARISGVVQLGTDGQGHLTAGFSDADVALSGFDYDTSLIPGDWSFGEDTVAGIVEGVLVDQVNELVPGLMEEQLSTLDLAFDLDLLGTPVSLGTAFRAAFIDADGVQLIADLELDVPAQATKQAPGFLTADVARPTPNTVDDLTLALSDDMVNRLLFEVWRGGLVDQTLSTTDGTLPAEYLADFGADEGTLSLDAQLPPVLVQRGSDTELQLGELHARLETPGNANFSFIDFALSAKMPVDLEVEQGNLTIALGTPALSFDIRDTDWAFDESGMVRLIEERLPIEDLILSLGVIEFELPEIAGIALETARIDRDGSGVFTNIAADL